MKDRLIGLSALVLAGSVAVGCTNTSKSEPKPTKDPAIDKNNYGQITVFGSLARDTGYGFTCYSEEEPKTDIGAGTNEIVDFNSKVFCENNVLYVSKGDMPAQDFGIKPDTQYPSLQVITDMPVVSHPQ